MASADRENKVCVTHPNYPEFLELRSPVLFWDLPVEERDVPLIHPITSNGQSMGFKDGEGHLWLGILTDEGLRRKRFSHSPVSEVISPLSSPALAPLVK